MGEGWGRDDENSDSRTRLTYIYKISQGFQTSLVIPTAYHHDRG